MPFRLLSIALIFLFLPACNFTSEDAKLISKTFNSSKNKKVDLKKIGREILVPALDDLADSIEKAGFDAGMLDSLTSEVVKKSKKSWNVKDNAVKFNIDKTRFVIPRTHRNKRAANKQFGNLLAVADARQFSDARLERLGLERF